MQEKYRIEVVKNDRRETKFYPQMKGLFGWIYLGCYSRNRKECVSFKTQEDAQKVIDLRRADQQETISYIVNC